MFNDIRILFAMHIWVRQSCKRRACHMLKRVHWTKKFEDFWCRELFWKAKFGSRWKLFRKRQFIPSRSCWQLWMDGWRPRTGTGAAGWNYWSCCLVLLELVAGTAGAAGWYCFSCLQELLELLAGIDWADGWYSSSWNCLRFWLELQELLNDNARAWCASNDVKTDFALRRIQETRCWWKLISKMVYDLWRRCRPAYVYEAHMWEKISRYTSTHPSGKREECLAHFVKVYNPDLATICRQ